MSVGRDKRFLVVALDGATFDLIRPLADRGELPFISEVAARGCSMSLLSTVPPITPPAWSSFATGSPPSEHGVFGFNYPDPSDYSLRLTTAADLRRPTLWQRLSRAGFRVLLLDVPFTFPPEPVSGSLIAGFPLPEAAPFTHPLDLTDRLESQGVACARYPTDAPDPATPDFLAWLDEITDNRLRLFRHLTRRAAGEPWQFAMVGTMAIDWAQHALWKYFDRRFVFSAEPEAAERRETLFACYRRMDRFAADLADIAGDETTTVLVSDHGFGATFHYDWVTEALSEADLLRWRGGGRRLATTAAAAMLKAARSSPRLQRLGKRWLGDTAQARTWARCARAYSQIDWERTRVFAAGDYHLNLYVNWRSRFAGGIVQSGADYEKVLNDTVAALEAFRPPGHDQQLVRRIVRVEGGARALSTKTPDLSLELAVLPMPDDPRTAMPMAGICGFHTPEGILMTNAANWLEPDRPAKIGIADLAPAILEYLEVPDDRGKMPVTPVERGASAADFSAEERAVLLDRLRNLGYSD